MARARNIKPGIFKNEILGVADPLYTLLFEGLWLLADREGRLEDRPVRIKGELFPYRDGLDVDAMLSWLEQGGFIRRYSSNGLAIIQIVAFGKHQTPHGTEKDSDLPDESGLYTVHVRSANNYATGSFSLVDRSLTVKPQNANLLTPDSGFLIPDSGLRIPAAPAAPAAPPPPAKAKRQKTGLPADFGVSDRVQTWANERGYGRLPEHLEAFKRKASANGYAYADWDSAFMEAIREDWAKLRGKAPNGAAPPPESRPSKGPDPALQKIEEDSKKAAPMPEAIRSKISEALKGKVLQ